MKITIQLKTNDTITNYGEMWKDFRSEERKKLTDLQKANMVVSELNKLLPSAVKRQKVSYWFVKVIE